MRTSRNAPVGLAALPGAVTLGLVMSVASVASVAAAQTDPSPVPASASRRLTWNESWPRVRVWEYVATGASFGGVVALQVAGRPSGANWTGNFLFDFAIRDAFGTRDPSAISAWQTIGDIPFYAAMVFPAFDALLVAGAIHGNWDVAWQMIAMDLEAFAVALPLVYVTQYFVRRERPYAQYCGEVGGAPFSCESGNFTQSFPSGHVALVATTAGLTCAHHTRLPLYGGGVGDSMACATWIGAAALVGVARIAINKHYVTDVLAGLGIGAFAGYAVPVLLHYAMHSGDERDEAESVPRLRAARRSTARADARIMLAPFATGSSLGLRALGSFR